MLLASSEPFGFSIAEWAIVAAGVIFAVDRVIDRMGWNKSSQTLRQENSDLSRINSELTLHNKSLSAKQDESLVVIQDLTKKVAVLESQVEEMKKRDQEAVLAALRGHEVQAEARTVRIIAALTEIKHGLDRQGGGEQ